MGVNEMIESGGQDIIKISCNALTRHVSANILTYIYSPVSDILLLNIYVLGTLERNRDPFYGILFIRK